MRRVKKRYGPTTVADVNTLRERCPGIEGWQIGKNQSSAIGNGVSWDGALITDHAACQAIDEYRTDLCHIKPPHYWPAFRPGGPLLET